MNLVLADLQTREIITELPCEWFRCPKTERFSHPQYEKIVSICLNGRVGLVKVRHHSKQVHKDGATGVEYVGGHSRTLMCDFARVYNAELKAATENSRAAHNLTRDRKVQHSNPIRRNVVVVYTTMLIGLIIAWRVYARYVVHNDPHPTLSLHSGQHDAVYSTHGA